MEALRGSPTVSASAGKGKVRMSVSITVWSREETRCSIQILLSSTTVSSSCAGWDMHVRCAQHACACYVTCDICYVTCNVMWYVYMNIHRQRRPTAVACDVACDM